MKAIVRNKEKYSLINIPKTELKNTTNCNEEVITTFSLTDSELKYIEMGVDFTYTDKIVLGDTTEVDKSLELLAMEQIKQEKAREIQKLATITDQLNLLARTLYKMTGDSIDPEIVEARKVYEGIQNILNK